MSYYDEQMCKLLSRRGGDWLLTHGWPRTTAFLGIIVGLLSAYLCSIGLLSIGLQKMAVRFALNAVAGYAAFLLYLGLWLLRISSVTAKSLVIDGDQPITTEVPGDSEFDRTLSDSMDDAIRHSGCEVDSALGVLIMAGFLGLLFVGCHFVFHAPWYLGKLMVDGGKIQHRSTPIGHQFDFLVLPLRQTWPVALLLVIHYMTVGAALQSMMQGH